MGRAANLVEIDREAYKEAWKERVGAKEIKRKEEKENRASM